MGVMALPTSLLPLNIVPSTGSLAPRPMKRQLALWRIFIVICFTSLFLFVGGIVGMNLQHAEMHHHSHMTGRRDFGMMGMHERNIDEQRELHSKSPKEKRPPFPPEVWAGGYESHSDLSIVNRTRSLLTTDELHEVSALCGRCLYHTLTNYVEAHDIAHWNFVATGDIPSMWIRDSSVQMAIYFPRSLSKPSLRLLLEGTLRMQAFLIVQDPYANAFNSKWKRPSELGKFERLLGRGGWVSTRNYELDSGAYFINFLYNYWATTYSKHSTMALPLLSEPLVFDAVELMIDTWIIEQNHEEKSSYRYSELPREGLGSPVAFTGMTWSGFRPSDDPNVYGYSIPSNIYALGALHRVLAINEAVWMDSKLEHKVERLINDIVDGINKYGIVEVEPGVRIYAYEVDGLGNYLADFDDANVPSLLAIPLLGWDGYDKTVYENTRKRLLDSKYNKYFFSGDIVRGIGSPHTGSQYVWPLALIVQALTTVDSQEKANMTKMLLQMQCGNGLMHESVNVKNIASCTRPIFEWANAMFVVLAESTFNIDCSKSAEVFRLNNIQMREKKDTSKNPRNKGNDSALYYESLESLISFDSTKQV